MILRIVFFAIMALGLVGFGTVAWVSTRPPPTPAASAPVVPTTKTMLVAGRGIHAGSLLKPEDFAGKEVPLNDPAATNGNSDTPETRRALVGAMVRRSLSPGDVVRESDVMRPGDHGFLAAVLQPGMRAVTIAVDNTTGSAGLIWPGDHVDLILTQSLQDAALPMGRRVAAETVLSDARVIAIDAQLVEGAAPTGATDNQARTVTLEVTPDQAERISVAMRLGRLSLSVRSADGTHGTTVASAGGTNTTWAVDVSPALGISAPAPSTSDNTVRIFQGAGDVKEYKF
jgi:pilus assembly protein CpaB